MLFLGAEVGTVLIKLAGQFVLPIVLEEATKYAARKAVRKGVTLATVGPIQVHNRPIAPNLVSSVVISDVPGRLRFRLSDGQDELGLRTGLDLLRNLPGVTDVSAGSLTGNVLVRYDPRTIGRARILAAVDSLVQQRQHLGNKSGQNSVKRHLVLVGG